jgi:hypothetical protein
VVLFSYIDYYDQYRIQSHARPVLLFFHLRLNCLNLDLRDYHDYYLSPAHPLPPALRARIPGQTGAKHEIKHQKTPKKTPKPEIILFHPSGAFNIRGGVLLLTCRSSGARDALTSRMAARVPRRFIARCSEVVSEQARLRSCRSRHPWAGSYINYSIKFLRRSQQRSYQPMPSGVGTPRDEPPHNPRHHARCTPPRPKNNQHKPEQIHAKSEEAQP